MGGTSTKIPIADKMTFNSGSSGILESVGPRQLVSVGSRLLPLCLYLAGSVSLICRTSPKNHHTETVKNIVPVTAWPINLSHLI